MPGSDWLSLLLLLLFCKLQEPAQQSGDHSKAAGSCTPMKAIVLSKEHLAIYPAERSRILKVDLKQHPAKLHEQTYQSVSIMDGSNGNRDQLPQIR
jgi:hypothetical protein